MITEETLSSGNIYDPSDRALMAKQLYYIEFVNRYNKTHTWQILKRNRLLKKMFAEIGKDCYIEPPFHSNFGGRHVHFGDNVYANFNLTLVDDAHIYVGDHTMIGPNCTLCTAAHPIEPNLREKGLQYNKPVRIGKNVWLGAGVTVLPGVTIGDNSIIGAGSLVTKDIPANVVAFGIPCKVQREI